MQKREGNMILSTFLGFIGLGLSLAIPVGAVTIEIVKQGIRCGFWHSLLVASGALCADIVFMTLIYAGLAQFLMDPLPKMIIWVMGFITLLYLGWDSVKEGFRPVVLSSGNERGKLQCFLSGFSLAALNPINILFWLGIYGSALATIVDKVRFSETLLYSSAIFVGVFMWDLFVSSSVHFSRKLFNPLAIRLLSVVAGVSLIGFGVYFGFQIIQFIHA